MSAWQLCRLQMKGGERRGECPDLRPPDTKEGEREADREEELETPGKYCPPSLYLRTIRL